MSSTIAPLTDKAPTTNPQDLHTYHCLCTHLILASNRTLDSFPRRSTLDKAHILNLTPSHASSPQYNDYSVLLGTTPDDKPTIIRRPDGFEKMYMQRCGRCTTIVGYQLDKSQFPSEKEDGKKEYVVFVLPGGLLTSEEMEAAKDMSAGVGFHGVGATVGGR
ncbi:Saccharopine dehydrogenase [Venturia nashicola]|nr:Saccharopine dehydrogenase [Venturia nashicola]